MEELADLGIRELISARVVPVGGHDEASDLLFCR